MLSQIKLLAILTLIIFTVPGHADFQVEGHVKKAGIFPWKQGMTALDAIEAAGGIEPFFLYKGKDQEREVPLLVELQWKKETYFIAYNYLKTFLKGKLSIDDNAVLNVQPWTATDLAKTLTFTIKLPPQVPRMLPSGKLPFNDMTELFTSLESIFTELRFRRELTKAKTLMEAAKTEKDRAQAIMVLVKALDDWTYSRDKNTLKTLNGLAFGDGDIDFTKFGTLVMTYFKNPQAAAQSIQLIERPYNPKNVNAKEVVALNPNMNPETLTVPDLWENKKIKLYDSDRVEVPYEDKRNKLIYKLKKDADQNLIVETYPNYNLLTLGFFILPQTSLNLGFWIIRKDSKGVPKNYILKQGHSGLEGQLFEKLPILPGDVIGSIKPSFFK